MTFANLGVGMIKKTLGAAVTALVAATVMALAAWFVFAWLGGATLVTFRTGSMAPTMPQGAVAVTLPTGADALDEGDVVTVERDLGSLPITHRVLEVRVPAEASDPRLRELVLQGDANATPDVEPYLVTDVRRVVLSMPHLGSALMVLQSPIGMGGLTVLAGALATWAFWPRRDDPAGDPAAEDAGASVAHLDALAPATQHVA